MVRNSNGSDRLFCRVRFIPIVTARELQRVCAELFPKNDCLIMTAAVCDFAPAAPGRHKIPSAKGLALRLKRTPDILAGLAERKGGRTVIGFCLETKDLIRKAKAKLRKKGLDGIVANFYGSGCVPFGKRRVEVHLISSDRSVLKLTNRSKDQIARALLGWMGRLSGNSGTRL